MSKLHFYELVPTMWSLNLQPRNELVETIIGPERGTPVLRRPSVANSPYSTSKSAGLSPAPDVEDSFAIAPSMRFGNEGGSGIGCLGLRAWGLPRVTFCP